MSEQKTPTTERVRDLYRGATGWRWEDHDDHTDLSRLRASLAAEFDAWLAEHDAKVRADALREAADKFEQNPDGEWGFWMDYQGWSMDATEPLREEADRIEREAGLK